MFGGAERDRTADLLVANEALSQLSYRPTTAGDTQTVYQRMAGKKKPAAKAAAKPRARADASKADTNKAGAKKPAAKKAAPKGKSGKK